MFGAYGGLMMQEFRSVEIDLDVHKRIELAREGFSETPNAVLRRLLGVDMPSVCSAADWCQRDAFLVR